jgi:hypothetical protein
MRLAFITPAFPPQNTGLALSSAEICSYLAEHGHTVRAFIPDYYFSKIRSSPLISPKLELFPLASLPNPFDKGQFIIASFPIEIPMQVAKFKPDLVYYINPQIHQFPFLSVLLTLKRIPLITSYEPPMSPISSFLIGTFSMLAKRIIVRSKVAADYLAKFGLQGKTIIIPAKSRTEFTQYEHAFNLH